MTRPGEIEINAWKDMLGDMDGAENWSWDSFFAAMEKSETFTPPTDAVVQEAGITWNASSHGTNGPIHMSYPGWYVQRLSRIFMLVTTLQHIPTGWPMVDYYG